LRASSEAPAQGSLRAELHDPAIRAFAIAIFILVTFVFVRLTGGAPSALMELGYAPIALAAYAFGWRGGLVTGLAVAAVFGPVPAWLGLERVEGPMEWLIRATSFAGIGTLVGRLLDRTVTEATEATAGGVDGIERERESLLALAKAAESRDTDAGEHVRRIELTSRRLAQRAGHGDIVAAEVGWAAMLHDLGKLRVPDRILLKPDPLDPDEWTIVRLHPIWTEEALTGGAHLEMARQIGRSHHENWDGSGYPDGLYGDQIPLPARIVRITDAFDAMTNRRPYQQPVSLEAALEELQANAGRNFDPELVRTFGELIRNDFQLRTQLSDLRLA
jgi:hypothetical protein